MTSPSTMTDAPRPREFTIDDAVAQASPALLLAAIVSVTGDTSRVQEFTAHIRTSTHGFERITEMDPDARDRLNAWASEVIQNRSQYIERAPHTLDDETFRTLASALSPHPLPPTSVAYAREQGGFTSFIPNVEDAEKTRPSNLDVLVLGAGMAGVAMAVGLAATGFSFQVLEKQSAIGGVWQRNRYPGVGVDTPSKFYSLSFAINAEWTNTHPQGGEYREYLDRIAREQRVYDRFTFGAEVTDLIWNEHDARWDVSYIQDGRTRTTSARVVVTAAGYLSRPTLPDVPGIDLFRGHRVHSADFDTSYSYVGKRVAVIGAGCTSVQIVDALKDDVTELTLVQRTPHWVLPPRGESTVPDPERWLLSHVPTYKEWARLQVILMGGDSGFDIIKYDPEWASTHPLSVNASNHIAMEVALGHIHRSFEGRPDLVAKMTPNFPFMGKRPVTDPGAYYETLARGTSHVVSGLIEVDETGFVDVDGEHHEVDAIIYATGFALDYLTNLNIVGRDGRVLAEEWSRRPVAYLGAQVEGFPNLFITSGPNGNPAHGAPHNFIVEANVHYFIECLREMNRLDVIAMEPTSDAMKAWIEEVDERLAETIWAHDRDAHTYYRSAGGEITLVCPLLLQDYWGRMRRPDLAQLELRPRSISLSSDDAEQPVLSRAE
ncbi:flavin-containing monooxygenase [Microbacterium sp. AGC85]